MPIATVAAALTTALPAADWCPFDQVDPSLQRAIAAAVANPAAIQAVVTPADISTLAQVMQLADRHGWRVLLCGHGSKLAWGQPTPAVDLVISLARCDRVLDHAVGDLTVTVEAGCTLATVQAQVQATGQTIALDPSYPDQATLGGIMATGDAGSWRQRYGGVRDMIIGLTLVRPDGRLAKAGGKVVKNVAGYDLMKLFTGSYGSLGAIAEVTLRTYPWTDPAETVVLTGDADAIAQAVAQLRASVLAPTRADWLSPALSQAVLGVSADALSVRFCTHPRSVADQRDRWLELIRDLELTAQVLTDDAETQHWQSIQQAMDHPAAPDAAAPSSDMLLLKVGMQPTALPTWNAAIAATVPHADQVRSRLHIGSGIGMVRLPADGMTSHRLHTLRSVCAAAQGYLVVLEAPIALKQQVDVWGYAGNAVGLMQQIKAQFDPTARLSPGRFVGGI